MKTTTTLAGVAVAIAVMGPGPVADDVVIVSVPQARFEHARHQLLFPDCTTCHANVAEGEVYPDPTFCAACHDGTTQPRVDWTPTPAPPRYAHGEGLAALDCATCHLEEGNVRRAAPPPSHDLLWRDTHGTAAAASTESCITCHVRQDCLACHRAGAASPEGGYHPSDFLSLHPAAAYSRETSCADCHNTGAFCQTCHLGVGLVSGSAGTTGYHDGTGAFTIGHGQAARQSLETCVSCHVEQNCVRCHIRVNPHGPSFNAEKQRESSPSVCVVCHGQSIPGGGG